jgi:hypothetical protein
MKPEHTVVEREMVTPDVQRLANDQRSLRTPRKVRTEEAVDG